MSNASVQILAAGTEALPFGYTVPNTQEVEPLSVNATFDGTGASGPFVPTLEVVSDGGVVIARVPAGSTVAAGGTAEVTFAPFLRQPQTSSSLVSSVTALGLQSETLPIWLTSSNSLANAAGQLFTQVFPYGFAAGTKLTGFFGGQWTNSPGAGTGHITYGLCDATGLVIATTGNLGSSFWTASGRLVAAPFTAAVTLAQDTFLYAWLHGFLGTWATQPGLAASTHATTFLQQVPPNDWKSVLGSFPPQSTNIAFGTTAPALGSTIALDGPGTGSATISIYMGVY